MGRPTMRAMIGGAMVGVALLAAWRLWPAATGPGAIESGRVLEAGEAEMIADAKSWLEERFKSVTPITGRESFESAAALDAAGAMLASAGLTRADAEAALAHASALMHARFVVRDGAAYTRWRREAGYVFFPVSRMRDEPVMREQIERGAGRALRDDEQDSGAMWEAYWRNSIETSPRVTAMDPTADGTIMNAWRAAEGLAHRMKTPARRGVYSRIVAAPGTKSGTVLGRWRGSGTGQGWPLWLPPDDVEARLERAGTCFIEIGWILQTEQGRFQPFILTLGMDPQTRRWWAMQFFIPHIDRGVELNVGGL
ncbi:MAG: hypothetical protein JNK35_12310 [Phycisphaerae bacterium]|nr:hypothetical protein [Phycisphaerae bacterium]